MCTISPPEQLKPLAIIVFLGWSCYRTKGGDTSVLKRARMSEYVGRNTCTAFLPTDGVHIHHCGLDKDHTGLLKCVVVPCQELFETSFFGTIYTDTESSP